MKGFDPAAAFGASVAADYDDTPRGDEAESVQFLTAVAQQRQPESPSALEFAIGTGRIGLELVERGVRVDGIEISGHMMDRLQNKPGGSTLDVRLGDMATTTTGKTYPLVYLVFNTIFNLLTQDDQVRCFENAAHHLTQNGIFLVEAAVPSACLPKDQYVNAEKIEPTSVTFDVCRYDPATQILDENHVSLTEGGVRFNPVSCRLAWPSELDLMARIAGLQLVERWGGWNREPYTGRGRHVSLYGRRDA